MMMKRIGSWPWALSRDERLAAAAIGRSQNPETPVSAKVKHRYGAMLVKQKKLLARVA
jgi:hypothetical protein